MGCFINKWPDIPKLEVNKYICPTSKKSVFVMQAKNLSNIKWKPNIRVIVVNVNSPVPEALQ